MSIDKAVRQVVTEVVDEVMTDKIDEKVKETVVEIQDDDFKDKVLEVLSSNDLSDYISWDDIEPAVSSNLDVSAEVESAIEDINPDNIGAAWSEHDHDGYYSEDGHTHEDEPWVEDMISNAIENMGVSGGGGNQPIKKDQLEILLRVLGVVPSGNPTISGMSFASGINDTYPGKWQWFFSDMEIDTDKTVFGRINALEAKIALLEAAGDSGKFDKLMSWAAHIDKVLKAASSSQIFEEVPA